MQFSRWVGVTPSQPENAEILALSIFDDLLNGLHDSLCREQVALGVMTFECAHIVFLVFHTRMVEPIDFPVRFLLVNHPAPRFRQFPRREFRWRTCGRDHQPRLLQPLPDTFLRLSLRNSYLKDSWIVPAHHNDDTP